MTTEEKIGRLMKETGQGQIACGIALQLSGGDTDTAIERMKISYPEVK